MIKNLDSQYNCAQAGDDLHLLQSQLQAAKQSTNQTPKETSDLVNRLENQIHFIKNKCDIRP